MARKYILRVEFVETDDTALVDVRPHDWLHELILNEGESETIRDLVVVCEDCIVGEYTFTPKRIQE